MRKFLKVKRSKKLPIHVQLSVALCSGLGMMLSAWPTLSAEQITLSYPPLDPFSISVASLEAFAKDGTITPELAPFIKLAPPNQIGQLREALQKRFAVTPIMVSQFAATQTGKTAFNRVGQILQTSKKQNGGVALQTAFAKAAANPQGMTILELFQQFPDTSINVNGQLGFQAVSAVLKSVGDRDLVVAAIKKQAIAAPAVTIPAQPDMLKSGPMNWTIQTLNFQNPNRPDKSLQIPASIYIPEGLTAPAPVIVISHGLGSNRSTFAYLAEHLASYGFVVAIPEHPGTSTAQVDQFLAGKLDYDPVLGANEIINRPLDIKYLLDALAQKASSDPNWQGKMNLENVGVFGQSLGGYTVLATAGATLDYAAMREQCPKLQSDIYSFNVSLPLQCSAIAGTSTIANFRDERVKAVIAVNPVTSLLLGQTGISKINIPTLIASGTDDVFAPPIAEQVIPFTWLKTPEKYLMLLQRGTHFSFLGDEMSGNTAFAVPPEILGPSPALARPAMKAVGLAFFKRFLTNDNRFQPYLSQSYVQKLNQSPFGFDFTSSFSQADIQQAIAPPRKSPNSGKSK
jgi:predicted dienelactone hydrolase